MIRTPMGYGQQVSRPVMSFEEAMKGALEKSASNGDPSINKWGVEVFFRIPFEGESSYHHDYPKHPITPFKDAAGVQTTGYTDSERPRIPFTGTTTNKDTYVKHAIQVAAPVEAHAASLTKAADARPSIRFEGQSSYDLSYKAPSPSSYPTSPEKANPGDAAAAAPYTPTRVPFAGTTTSSDVFKAPPPEAYHSNHRHPSPAPSSASPDHNPRVKFEGTTTNRDTYKAHPLPSKDSPVAGHSNQPDGIEYRRLAEDRTFETTSGSTYKATPARERGMTSGINVEADKEGRLKVYVDRAACVDDLKQVLEELTMISADDQVLVRLQDGSEMRDGGKSLVDELRWNSGEELTLTSVKERMDAGNSVRQQLEY